MKTIHIFSLFVLLALIQLSVPAQMIFKRESILNTGIAYKFKTQPVDPSDPFKGKYIFLNYDVNNIKVENRDWQRQQNVYISIANDSLGFVKATSASIKQPKNGMFVKARVDWYSVKDNSLRFTFPFNEFYMEESKAYNAEIAHRNAQRDSLPNNTYALVFVKDGQAVLDNVFINDVPIAKFVEE